MEYRLIVAGVLLGAYGWAARRFEKSLSGAFWHSLFWGLAGFSAALILAALKDWEPGFARVGPLTLPVAHVPKALGIALLGAAFGWWRGRDKDKKKAAERMKQDLEWADTVFSSALLAAPIMLFLAQAFNIPSGSMEKSLLIGDHLFINKLAYGLRVPVTGQRLLPLAKVKRGDIVVFQFPTERPDAVHCGTREYGRDLIKRVVGLPGETVEVKAGKLYIDGKALEPEPYAQWTDAYRQPAPRELPPKEHYQHLWQSHELDQHVMSLSRDYFGPVVVPPGSYFVMGDNRDHSCDSRYWGPVEKRYVKGKAWFIYWPPRRIGAVR